MPEAVKILSQEELRQASQTLPGAVITDKAERSVRARSETSNLPTPLPSARAVEPQQLKAAELPPVTVPPQVVEVVYDAAPLEKQVSSASTASVSDSGKQKEGKEPPAEVVIPFDRRPPFVSGPFKERVKVPSIKLVPVADAKPAGKYFRHSCGKSALGMRPEFDTYSLQLWTLILNEIGQSLCLFLWQLNR